MISKYFPFALLNEQFCFIYVFKYFWVLEKGYNGFHKNNELEFI